MSKTRLKKERMRRDWTQDYVAEKTGTTKQTVCNWEKGRRIPRLPILLKLEDLFGLSHRELFAPANDEDPSSLSN